VIFSIKPKPHTKGKMLITHYNKYLPKRINGVILTVNEVNEESTSFTVPYMCLQY
jgi:hypothetical protein